MTLRYNVKVFILNALDFCVLPKTGIHVSVFASFILPFIMKESISVMCQLFVNSLRNGNMTNYFLRNFIAALKQETQK